jgi:hypothetical protein
MSASGGPPERCSCPRRPVCPPAARPETGNLISDASYPPRTTPANLRRVLIELLSSLNVVIAAIRARDDRFGGTRRAGDRQWPETPARFRPPLTRSPRPRNPLNGRRPVLAPPIQALQPTTPPSTTAAWLGLAGFRVSVVYCALDMLGAEALPAASQYLLSGDANQLVRGRLAVHERPCAASAAGSRGNPAGPRSVSRPCDSQPPA